MASRQPSDSRARRYIHLLFCGCSKKKASTDYVAVHSTRLGSPTKPRLTIPATRSDGSPTRHTTSSSGSDNQVVEVLAPLRHESIAYANPLPTREILRDDAMPEVSFLTIEPLLMSVSTDPDGQFHDRRDDGNLQMEDDDISDVTEFRDYSLISM